MPFIQQDRLVSQVEGILYQNKALQEQVVDLTKENAALKQELDIARRELYAAYSLIDGKPHTVPATWIEYRWLP